MIEMPDRRITPWVGRILAINAVVLLLQQTIFTSEYLKGILSFDASLGLQHPWTFITYMFVHAGLFHLAGNSLALFVFGPTVERRLGSRGFLWFYLLCGVGAACFSMILNIFNLASPSEVLPNGVIIGSVGASGAIMGVAYAYARLLPDAQLIIFPIPLPVKAKYLIMLLAAYDVVGLFVLNDNIAHDMHIGGLLTGITYFLLRSLGRPSESMPLPSIRQRVPVATRSAGPAGHQALVTPHSVPAITHAAPDEAPAGARDAAELDRVLDKISASGIGSLTADERHFLDAMARRRRDLH
jgi:membrane associated rhomboid family serine protease